MELSAEINVFINEGAAHVKLLVPAVPDGYDKDGNVLGWSAPEPKEIASQVAGIWKALEAAGYKPSGQKRGGGFGKKPEQKAVAVKTDAGEIEVKCPKCQGQVWDNRPKKADGTFSPKSPDFKCKDKDCGGVIWSWTDVVVEATTVEGSVDPADLPFE